MEYSTPRYQGKPTAYLDHNILDLLVKTPSLKFKAELKEKFQIIYSDENLKEIKRTGDKGFNYLKLLEEFEAMYLKLILTSEFKVTGDATITELSPFVAFDKYCENIGPVYESIEQSISQSLLKFYGGRSDADFDDINNGQIDAFDNLMSHRQDLGNEISETESGFPEIGAKISAYTKEIKGKNDIALAQSANELRKHIDDENNYSGVKNSRSYTGIGPIQLNDIEHHNVIEQIWEAHSELDGNKDHDSYIGHFYGDSLSPLYNREMFFFENVTSTYNVLNVVGYHPDFKMKKERRFTAAMSDAGHAYMGSFADYVFSRDLAFVRKTRACYEFLNTKAQVVEVTVSDV
jgi:hypothetical protein